MRLPLSSSNLQAVVCFGIDPMPTVSSELSLTVALSPWQGYESFLTMCSLDSEGWTIPHGTLGVKSEMSEKSEGCPMFHTACSLLISTVSEQSSRVLYNKLPQSLLILTSTQAVASSLHWSPSVTSVSWKYVLEVRQKEAWGSGNQSSVSYPILSYIKVVWPFSSFLQAKLKYLSYILFTGLSPVPLISTEFTMIFSQNLLNSSQMLWVLLTLLPEPLFPSPSFSFLLT